MIGYFTAQLSKVLTFPPRGYQTAPVYVAAITLKVTALQTAFFSQYKLSGWGIAKKYLKNCLYELKQNVHLKSVSLKTDILPAIKELNHKNKRAVLKVNNKSFKLFHKFFLWLYEKKKKKKNVQPTFI